MLCSIELTYVKSKDRSQMSGIYIVHAHIWYDYGEIVRLRYDKKNGLNDTVREKLIIIYHMYI